MLTYVGRNPLGRWTTTPVPIVLSHEAQPTVSQVACLALLLLSMVRLELIHRSTLVCLTFCLLRVNAQVIPGGLSGGNGFTGYPPYTTALVTANGGYPDPYGGMVGGMRYEDRMRGLRSPLLEEFRANRHRRWDLTVSFSKVYRLPSADAVEQDIRGYIVEFSSDQLGSRHLQTKLDNASFEERQM